MRTPAVVLLVVLIGAAVAFAVDANHDELAARTGRPPIVVIVLDEFPTESLTTPSGEIDAERYPNFAALAETSTWFRNGYTVFDSTFKALPSILDGRMPADKTAADVRSHQPSVYHLMHRLGYDDRQGGVRLGRLPACGSARAPARGGPGCCRGWRAAGVRRGCTGGPGRSATAAGRPSTSTTRCFRTSPGSTCPRDIRAGRPAWSPSPRSTSPRAGTTPA